MTDTPTDVSGDELVAPDPGPFASTLRPWGDGPVPSGSEPDRREGAGEQDADEGAGLRPEALFPSVPPGVDASWFVHVVHHVTETVPKAANRHRAMRLLVPNTGNAVPVLAKDLDRDRATILNLSSSAATVSIGDDGVQPGGVNSFPLAPGASMDVRDTEACYAIAEAAGVTVLAVWVTRRVDEEDPSK